MTQKMMSRADLVHLLEDSIDKSKPKEENKESKDVKLICNNTRNFI